MWCKIQGNSNKETARDGRRLGSRINIQKDNDSKHTAGAKNERFIMKDPSFVKSG